MNSGLLGPIYSANQIAIHSVHVNAQGYGLIDLRFASETLGEHVGRSITIHSGPVSSPCSRHTGVARAWLRLGMECHSADVFKPGRVAL